MILEYHSIRSNSNVEEKKQQKCQDPPPYGICGNLKKAHRIPLGDPVKPFQMTVPVSPELIQASGDHLQRWMQQLKNHARHMELLNIQKRKAGVMPSRNRKVIIDTSKIWRPTLRSFAADPKVPRSLLPPSEAGSDTSSVMAQGTRGRRSAAETFAETFVERRAGIMVGGLECENEVLYQSYLAGLAWIAPWGP